jgi:predicted aspartyl protease
VFDSGFTGSLTLPPATVAALGLNHHSSAHAKLADGTVTQFEVYAAEIEWGASWMTVFVSAVGTEPLVGAKLVIGHEVRIEYLPGGAMEIAPLPTFPLWRPRG